MKGTVKKILRNAGFIQTEEGKEVFFRQPFKAGDEVEFELEKDDQDRTIAVNVRREKK